MADSSARPVEGAADLRVVRLEFLGQGREYFGIWFTNLMLTVLTLGVYSAWAKVRRLRYFHRNTLLDGQAFDYHGQPRSILVGRVLMLTLVILLQVGSSFDPWVAGATTLIFYGVLPWMLDRSMQFRWRMTSWRNLRFDFRAQLWKAYLVFLIWPVVATLTLGLLAPMAHHAFKAYQMESVGWGNGADGPIRFRMAASRRDFIRVYGRYLILIFGLMAAGMFLAWQGARDGLLSSAPVPDSLGPALVAALIVSLVSGLVMGFVYPMLQGSLLRRIWDGARMGPLVFRSRISAVGWWWLSVSNLVLILLTLGFFRPFAVVRRLAYFVDHTEVLTRGTLEGVRAAAGTEVGALGDAGADMFDFDLGI